MLNVVVEEWIQILRNIDFISYPQMAEIEKEVLESGYEKVKEKVENIVRNNGEEKYKVAQKLYSYIKENYFNGNTNLCYKEILSDII